MIGNVWEWTPTGIRHSTTPSAGARAAFRTTAWRTRGGELRPALPEHPKIPRKVLKGGSHLCAPNYCRRYRPAARHAQPVDSSTSHVGFRCVIRQANTGGQDHVRPPTGSSRPEKLTGHSAVARRIMIAAPRLRPLRHSERPRRCRLRCLGRPMHKRIGRSRPTSSSSWAMISAGSTSAPITAA